MAGDTDNKYERELESSRQNLELGTRAGGDSDIEGGSQTSAIDRRRDVPTNESFDSQWPVKFDTDVDTVNSSHGQSNESVLPVVGSNTRRENSEIDPINTSDIQLVDNNNAKTFVQLTNTGAIGESSTDEDPASHNVSSDQTSPSTDPFRPVYYNSENGNALVVQEEVIVTRNDGSTVIETQGMGDQEEVRRMASETPLTTHRRRMLRIYAVIAAFMFFPTGIPALYFARRTETEYQAGIMRGNIDRARKFAKRSERLSILSVLFLFLVGILVLALVERMIIMNDEKYWQSSRNRLMFV